MSIDALQLIDPGLLTTVQDRGRYGYQRYGVPVSGAMDVFALRVANLLVGNDEDAAALEMTVLGPRIRFLTSVSIAVTGGDLDPYVDDEPLPMWRSAVAPEGSVLTFQGARDGVRSYLAVSGGIDVPIVMGSRSTYLKGAIGGLEGRALRAADVLRTMPAEADAELVDRALPHGFVVPAYGHQHEIRVVLGPQDKAFTADGIATFLGSEYSVSINSDRMGYRLEGPSIEHASRADLVSDGTPLGAVQVPGDGSPIILLADRGTTGGYTKIATVISADVDRLAQAMPSDTVRFKSVTVEEGQSISRRSEAVLAAIRGEVDTRLVGALGVVVEGEAFEVADESGEPIPWPILLDGHDANLGRRVRATTDGNTYEFEVEVLRED